MQHIYSSKKSLGILCVSIIHPRYTLIARFMGTTWGPSGADRTQVGPMLAPWTLLSGYRRISWHRIIFLITGLLWGGSTNHWCIPFTKITQPHQMGHRQHPQSQNGYGKGQLCKSLMYSLVLTWTSSWTNSNLISYHMHISVTKWWIVGYEIGASWDLCKRSVSLAPHQHQTSSLFHGIYRKISDIRRQIDKL